jgi:hypothetical protein
VPAASTVLRDRNKNREKVKLSQTFSDFDGCKRVKMQAMHRDAQRCIVMHLVRPQHRFQGPGFVASSAKTTLVTVAEANACRAKTADAREAPSNTAEYVPHLDLP